MKLCPVVYRILTNSTKWRQCQFTKWGKIKFK